MRSEALPMADAQAPEVLAALTAPDAWHGYIDAASIQLVRGETHGALELLVEALERADTPERQAVTLQNVAEVHALCGAWDPAARCYEASLSYLAVGLVLRPPVEARMRRRLTEAYLALDRLEDAAREGQAALAAYRRVDDRPVVSDLVETLDLVAEVYRRQEDWLGLGTSLEAALELERRELGPDDPVVLERRRALDELGAAAAGLATGPTTARPTLRRVM